MERAITANSATYVCLCVQLLNVLEEREKNMNEKMKQKEKSSRPSAVFAND